ncbi:MAG: hypothetical protein LBH11_07470 [Propionibacteriaceae bacterium]|jgi:cell division septation protein DedD|nr:hypothetical protein [Propionibacteriaceae bacterium]
MSSENTNDPIENIAEPAENLDGLGEGTADSAEAAEAPVPAARAIEVNELDEDSEHKKKGGVWFNRVLLVVGVLLIAVGAVLGVMELLRTNSGNVLVDMDGNAVQPDEPIPDDEEWLNRVDLQEISGARFIVDSVGLNVPYGEVNEVDGVLNPPNFRGVFRVRNRGVDLPQASQGTVYLITHSVLTPGHAPGNYLMDIYKGTWSLAPGDIIQVNGTRYVADSYTLVDGDQLGSYPEFWRDEPGRLIIITCMQYPDKSRSWQRLFIVGHLEGFTAPPTSTVTQPTTAPSTTEATEPTDEPTVTEPTDEPTTEPPTTEPTTSAPTTEPPTTEPTTHEGTEPEDTSTG